MVQCADDMSSLISHLASNNAMSDYIHHCLRHSLIPQWRDHISANSFHISKQITESHHAPSKFTTFEVVVNILPMFSNGEKNLIYAQHACHQVWSVWNASYHPTRLSHPWSITWFCASHPPTWSTVRCQETHYCTNARDCWWITQEAAWAKTFSRNR